MKKIKTLLILTLMIVCLPLTALAAEGITLDINKTNLEVGDEVTVSAKVSSDLDAYALIATLKYDTNVFETIDDSNFVVQDTSSINYSQNTNKFGIINKSGKVSTGGTLFTVKLRVKDDANVGNTNIALTNISYSSGTGKKTLDMVSTKVFVSRDAKEGETIPIQNENIVTEDVENEVKAVSNVPVMSTLLVAIVILLASIIYIKLTKKSVKSFYFLIALETVLIITESALVIGNINKKDVNKDGINDYNDAEEIIKYLINIEGTDEDLNLFDGNNVNSTNNNNVEQTQSSVSSSNSNSNNRQNQTNQSNSNSSNNNKVTNGSSSNKQTQTNSNGGNSNSNNGNANSNVNNESANSNTNNNENNGNANSNANSRNSNANNGNADSNTNNNQNNGTNNNTNNNTSSDKNTNTTTNDDNENNNETVEPNPPNKEDKPSEDFDVNNDGNVDIDDAGQSAEDTTNKSKVILKEKIEENSSYSQKGDINIKFTADITPVGTKITEAKINSEYYETALEGDVYTAKINNIEKAGKHSFNIEEVVLDNGKKVNTNLKIEKDILKDAPYINKFNLDDQKGTLSFDVIDEEDAFIDGTVTIKRDEDLVKTEKVKSKDSTVITNIPIEDDETYLIEIIGKYDLDSDKNDQKNVYNTALFSHTFMIGGDYNFNLTDASITDVVKTEETPVLKFRSSNTKNKIIENANLKNDGEVISNCEVTKLDNDNYEINLNGAKMTPGIHTITLDSVNMDTLKSFTNKQDFNVNSLTYTVLKDAPSVENLTVSDKSSEKKISAQFKLIDKTQAITKLTVALVDSANRIAGKTEIATESLTDKENIKTEVPYGNNTDGRFKVKVLANYELADKYVYTDESLAEKEILTHSEEDISIESIYVVDNSNKQIDSYAKKGQKDYQIFFKVNVSQKIQNLAVANHGNGRAYGRVSAININGLNYPASQVGKNDFTSKVFLTIPEESGVIELKANRVELASDGYYKIFNDYFSVPEKTMKIEVLKDAPKIENLSVSENYENSSSTFNFNVVLDEKEKADGFTDGIVELNGKTQEIHSGENSVTFTGIEKDKTFDLIFKGSYDLDTDELNTVDGADKNQTQNGVIYKVKYGLYSDKKYENIALDKCEVLSEKNNKYFEKNEKIKLNFDITGIDEDLGAVAKKVVIDDKEYDISKTDDIYSLLLDGYSSSGKKEITITDIILDNGREVKLATPYTFEFEVLKDIVKITDYGFEDLGSSIDTLLDIKDSDNSLVGNVKIEIKDEHNKILYNDIFKDDITFEKTENTVRYYITVTADYDRDIDKNKNSENYNENVILLDEVMSLDENAIEFKNITDINLYKVVNNKGYDEIKLIDEVDVEDIKTNKDSYFVEVKMDSLPTSEAKISEVIIEDDTLILLLDYKFTTIDNTHAPEIIRINYGIIKDGKAKNNYHPYSAFTELIEELNSGNNVTLTKDYDASSISTSENTYITSDYAGTLNGNGHTIKNLSKPLFNKITGNVENLKLVDISLSSNGQGALANTTEGATIKNVLVDKFYKSGTNTDGNGSLIGIAKKSAIEGCRSTNVNQHITGSQQQNSIFIGRTEDGTTVKNCYAQGTLQGGWNYTNAFIGNALSSTITNNYVSATINASGYNANFADAYNNKATVYENNICIGPNSFSGSYRELKNNYICPSDNSKKEEAGVEYITQEEITENLFKEEAKFDESIWSIKETSYNNLPILNIEIEEDKYSDIPDYDESLSKLYNNLMKLMPYYNMQKIVDTAKSVTDTNLLNKEIKYILPVDKNGSIVTYLTTSNTNKISKLKVIFTDDTKCEYDVKYDKMYDMVATYRINNLGIDYNYKHYVINSESQLVSNIVNYLNGLDYTTNLDILTTNASSRLYRDCYNEVTKKELKDFVLKYLSNSNYTNTTNDNNINNYLEREIKKDKRIEKVLYTYNYFRRFYDLDVDGMKIYDFVMFNMDCFDEKLTPEKIADLYLTDKTGASFDTARTNSSYISLLSNYTKLDTLPKFLEYIVTKFSNHDMSKWTHNQFKGIITEFGVDGHPEIKYTLWDHFISTTNDEILRQFLPMMTLPETAAYVISSPVQYAIGAQRTYMKNPNDPEEVKQFMEKLSKYTTRMKRYFETTYAILADADILNNALIYHIDKRTTKTETGGSVFNTQFTTTEPFHKNFVEATGLWSAAAGVNAVAWGPRLEWQVAGILDSTLAEEGKNDTSHVTFRTWSHESAHLIDSKVFLKNNGRRFDAGGEDYADAFFMQAFEEFGIVMNLSMRFNTDVKVGTNFTVDRINSKDKIQDYYRKVFETIYLMDYIEAQAFLELDLEEQKAVAVQASYPNENEKLPNGKTYSTDEYAKYRARQTTRYTRLNSISGFNTKLSTINDLIDNKIQLRSGAVSIQTLGDNRYGGEGFNVVHWYQPSNPDGRPDSYSLKWLSYEMLGYKGYDKGLVEYASNINYERRPIYSSFEKPENGTTDVNYKSDKMALEKISDGEYSDFDTYKKARFAEVAEKLERLDTTINVKEYVQKFYEALKKDAELAKSNEKTELTNSSALRSEIYYTLKNKTDDFRDEIYKSTKQQDVSNLKVDKDE